MLRRSTPAAAGKEPLPMVADRAETPRKTDIQPDPPARRWLGWIVFAAGLVVYANSVGGAFVFDDFENIVNNRDVHGAERWTWALTSRRPVVNLTFAANYALGGLDPRGYHAVNMVVHALAGLALFGFVRQTLLLERFGGKLTRSAPWLAFAIALLWTVHPLQTQSVTYVVQRAESLMGLFYLLTMYCFVRGATARHAGVWYAAAIACAVLGMGSKAVMVTVPLVALLYDWTFLSQSWGELLRKRWAFHAGLVGTWLVLLAVGVLGGVLFPPAGEAATVGFGYAGITPLEYLQTQPRVILQYLRLAFVPYPLSLDYFWPIATEVREIAPASVAVGLLLLATLWLLWRRHWLGFAGAWFFVILAPTSSFIPIKDVIFEHRMYLPLAGVVAAAVGAVYWLLMRRPLKAARAVGVVLCAAVALTLGTLTVLRNQDYRSALIMAEDLVQKQPENPRAWHNLGVTLRIEGRYADSIEPLQQSVRLDAEQWFVHDQLAQSLAIVNDFGAAVREYKAALVLNSENALVYNNLGHAYWALGRRADALAAYAEAVRLAPLGPVVRFDLADRLFEVGRVSEALRHYEEAVRLDDANAEAHLHFATVLANVRQIERACAELKRALELDPQFQLAQQIREQLHCP